MPQFSGLQRTFIYTQGQYLVATGSRHVGAQIHTMQSAKTWQSILREHPHSQWTCQWISNVPSIEDCCRLLYEGKAIGVSDGSYLPEKDLCSSAWIIKFHESLTLKGGGIVPGPAESSNAYRGELGGVLGQLVIIYTMEQYIPPTKPYDIQVACNGESALF